MGWLSFSLSGGRRENIDYRTEKRIIAQREKVKNVPR